jgi:hypothetical protein
VGLGAVVTRARVLVCEPALAEDLAEWRRAQSADNAGLEVEEHLSGHIPATRGLVISTLMRPSCASLPPQYMPPSPMPCSPRTTF